MWMLLQYWRAHLKHTNNARHEHWNWLLKYSETYTDFSKTRLALVLKNNIFFCLLNLLASIFTQISLSFTSSSSWIDLLMASCIYIYTWLNKRGSKKSWTWRNWHWYIGVKKETVNYKIACETLLKLLHRFQQHKAYHITCYILHCST